MIPNATKTTGVELTTIADLTPDERNANRGTQRGLAMLEDSLRRHGAGRSILVDKHGRVIAGNKTLESAASIGLEDVVIVKTDGTKIVAVQRTDIDLDTPEGRRLAVADNRTSEVGLDWDTDALSNLLADGLDTDGLFSAEELSDLLAVEPEPKDAPDAQIDRAEELRAQWGTERGQVWRVGVHRLMCGDSTDAGDVATLIDGAKAECMWTDPPYGVSIVGGFRRLSVEERKRERGGTATIANDTRDGLLDLLVESFSCAADVLEPGSPYYCARPPGEHSFLFADAVRKLGWKLHQELQWVKGNMVLGHSDYHLRHETIMYGWLPGEGRSGRGKHEGSRWYGDNAQTSVMEIALGESPDHPSMKPPALVAQHLRNSTPLGGRVYDPFLGSGTTLVAAEQLGRVCYGMEIEPRYVAVALQRMADMGLTPERA